MSERLGIGTCHEHDRRPTLEKIEAELPLWVRNAGGKEDIIDWFETTIEDLIARVREAEALVEEMDNCCGCLTSDHPERLKIRRTEAENTRLRAEVEKRTDIIMTKIEKVTEQIVTIAEQKEEIAQLRKKQEDLTPVCVSLINHREEMGLFNCDGTCSYACNDCEQWEELWERLKKTVQG